MRISLLLSDGQLITSDDYVFETPTADQGARKEIEDLLVNLGTASGIFLNVDGRMKYFNPRHVMWAEIE